MRIDAAYFGPPQGAVEAARAAKKAGMAGLWMPETGHDPFLSLLLASQAEPELEIGTAIAVAFARSPMTMAQTAWDLSALSNGKFHLGLGSQVKAHITRRFSMPWGKPVEQMRDFILALKAIWAAFREGGKLDYQGEYYKFSLLTPFFSPGTHEHKIPIGLAAVGPKMTELAGELADFVALHTFTGIDYLKQTTLPALEAGLHKAGRDRKEVTLCGSLFVILNEKMEAAVRQQVAFYGSTPAYAPVLESIGHGELATKLHGLSREGKWKEMATLIPEDVLEHFAMRSKPEELRGRIEKRFEGIYDRVMLTLEPSELQCLSL